jgi:hypothetical protein
VSEAAAEFGTSRQNVVNWINAGLLEAERVAGGHAANLGEMKRGFFFLISRTSIRRLKAKGYPYEKGEVPDSIRRRMQRKRTTKKDLMDLLGV